MGKPFNNELQMLKSTAEWADQQDVSRLTDFLFQQNTQVPLICIGSGGSLSACSYAALLNKIRNGVLATEMTPLELMYSGREIIRGNKLLYLSASGKNKDIQTAIKYGIRYNETGMMCLSLHKNNPTEQILELYPKVMSWCEEIPCGKDGFLATNSLLTTFILLSRSYNGEAVSKDLSFKGYTTNRNINLASIQNFIILYGAAGEPVAKDIESKLSEAALGTASLSDYRNFGHGRHHWFAKRKDDSCIIALVTPMEKELATITIKNLPSDVPIIYIDTELTFPKASIDLLINSFRFIQDLGKARGIDPGKPGVPSYGRKLYNLSYFKLTRNILPTERIIDIAVKRKLKTRIYDNTELYNYYRKTCKIFVEQLNKTSFKAIAFDYDGTLSAPNYTSRYTESLRSDIKETLELLLKNNIEIRIVTGRGRSIGTVFRNSINQIYWHLIKIGYYNGACLATLDNEDIISKWKNRPLDNELKILKEELLQRLPLSCIKYKFAERNLQLSIEDVTTTTDSEIIYTTCREIIWDKQLQRIQVWRSSHSMDIVVYREVSKLNVIEDPKHTLCLGDYGSFEGNDYELLTGPASLSVDKVSSNATCCWNIAPAGIQGLDATLYYLSHITVKNGEFKCKFVI